MDAATVVYQVAPIERDQLDETLRRYVCSNCWRELTQKWVDGKWYAVCPECKEETRGYVSKRFAKHQREKSERERVEASYNLRAALGLCSSAGKTRAQLLHEIGG